MKNNYQPGAFAPATVDESTKSTNLPAFCNPQTIEEADIVCQRMAQSGLVPKSFANRPNDIFVAMMCCHSLNMPIFQGLQSIAVINGKPSLYGDAVLALVRSSPAFESIKEEIKPGVSATCTVKRKGEEPHTQTFTMDQALHAGLLTRNPVWKTYPDRMMQMRARSYALRDVFPDVLMGMNIAEEVMDYADIDYDTDAAESAPAEAKRMPKRRSKVAAEKPAEKPVEAAEVVEEVEDVVEVQEVAQAPEQAAAPEPEDVPDTDDAATPCDATLAEIEYCQTLDDLMALWKTLPDHVKERVKGDFTNRRIEIQQGGNQ